MHSINLVSIVLTSALLIPGSILSQSAQQLPLGRWEGRIVYDSITIDFPLSWSASLSGTEYVLSFFNGSDSLSSSSVQFYGDSVIADFAHLATRLEGRISSGVFNGYYGNPGREERYVVTAKPFLSKERSTLSLNVPDISGTWIIPTSSSKGEKSWRFVVQQDKDSVTATILRVDGDAGALVGHFKDKIFRLSHFGGTRPSVMNIGLEDDGSLAISHQGPSTSERKYRAYRPDQALSIGIPEPVNFSTHTSVRDQDEVFAFSFPDVEGNLISNTDERFGDKVLVVNVTGSWCPNCHDEAPFLANLYKKYKDRGLEIVALDFEEEEQLEDLSRLRSFISRYNIDFPYLVAGMPSDVHKKLPQAVNLNTWPATFFIGRDGKVKAVRTGFASKASGAFHDEMVADYESIVTNLLATGTHR